MAFSETQICNRALSILGVSEIISLNQETPEARACKAVYETVRDMALSEFTWGFASSYKRLNKLTEEPLDEWENAYSFPNDALKIQRIYSESCRSQGFPFSVVAGNIIYTDVDDAVAKVTMRIVDSGLFPPHFIDLFSARLAIELAGTLQNISNRIEKANLFYQQSQQVAELTEGTQGKRRKERIPFVDARRGCVDSETSFYCGETESW